jgi:hypothetical protein
MVAFRPTLIDWSSVEAISSIARSEGRAPPPDALNCCHVSLSFAAVSALS